MQCYVIFVIVNVIVILFFEIVVIIKSIKGNERVSFLRLFLLKFFFTCTLSEFYMVKVASNFAWFLNGLCPFN